MHLALLVTVAAIWAQCTSPKQTTISSKPTETVFFDDFSGKELDRSKWNIVITGNTVNNEQQAYVDSAATIYIAHGEEAAGAANGALILQPHYAPGFTTPEGKKFDFISGRINTKDKVAFAYGTAAARIKLSGGAGLWPAWWLLGSGNWPQTGEIDIMEYIGEKDWTSVALHGPGYSGNTPLVKRALFSSESPVTDWHIYSVDWTPDSLIFKVDDRTVYTVTKPMVEQYGRWAFDNPKYLILNFALGGGYPAGVNGVQQPYYGLPASTVELIKAGKSKMLVDWVRVTKGPHDNKASGQ